MTMDIAALALFRTRLLQLVFVGIAGAVIWSSRVVCAQPWLATKGVGSDTNSTFYIKEYDLTPSVSTDIPDAGKYDSKAARLHLRLKERMAITVGAHASYGGRIVADYEAHAIGSLDTSSMTDKQIYFACRTNPIELRVGYYRGRVYYGSPSLPSDEWITVFSSVDQKRIMVIPDSGSLYVSDNSGALWRVISAPGDYEGTLSATSAGSAIVAVVSVAPTPDAARLPEVSVMATHPWYSVASAADGSQIVLTGGPAPALSIAASDDKIVLSWPASFTGFVLQQAADPTIADWQEVTDAVIITNSQHQVTTMPSKSSFFRLITHR